LVAVVQLLNAISKAQKKREKEREKLGLFSLRNQMRFIFTILKEEHFSFRAKTKLPKPHAGIASDSN
jgi:hypothetical protein